MPEPMQVELDTGPIQKATGDVLRLAQAYERLAAAEEKIAGMGPRPAASDAPDEGPVNAPGGGTMRRRSGRAGLAIPGGRDDQAAPETPAYRYLTGPRQRLERIEREIGRATAEGNQTVLGDLKARQWNAQRQIGLETRRMAGGTRR
jgi:hypothetical protein